MALNENTKFQALLTKAGKLKSDADAALTLLNNTAALTDVEIDKAVKVETKRVLDIVKEVAAEQANTAKDAGEKAVAKALAQLAKDVAAAAKA